MTESRIDAIATQLLLDGHVDNEPDARLAAVRLLVAADVRQVDGEQPRIVEHEHARGR